MFGRGAAEGGRQTEPSHTAPAASDMRNAVCLLGSFLHTHRGLVPLWSQFVPSSNWTPGQDNFSINCKGLEFQMKTLIIIKGGININISIKEQRT